MSSWMLAVQCWDNPCRRNTLNHCHLRSPGKHCSAQEWSINKHWLADWQPDSCNLLRVMVIPCRPSSLFSAQSTWLCCPLYYLDNGQLLIAWETLLFVNSDDCYNWAELRRNFFSSPRNKSQQKVQMIIKAALLIAMFIPVVGIP